MPIKNITISAFAFAILLTSCGEKKSESTAPVSAETPAVADTPSMEQTPVVYFEGAGHKPEWKLTVSANPDGSFLVTVKNEDQPEIKLNASKEPLYVDGKVNTASGEVKLSGNLNDGTPAQVIMITGACKDNDGKEHTHSCRFVSGKDILKGCGDYKE